MPCFVNGVAQCNCDPIETPNFYKQVATGAGVIAISWAVPEQVRLERLTVHWSAAPTTSENATLTLDSVDAAAYDTLLMSLDPSVDSLTDWACNEPWRFWTGDTVLFDYANTDTATIGVTLVFVQVDN